MSENKFIQHLKGKDTAKSVLEIKNQATPTTFANMPAGTSDATVVYSDHRGNATAVLKGTDNWKLSGATLVSATTVYGDGRDLTGSFLASGNTLWVNATYTFASPKIFTPNTKWVLKLCGHSLDSSVYKEIPFSLVIKIGNSILTKQFNIREEAFEFCKEFVIDFAESESATLHAEIGDTMNVQLLCGDASASATIYNGMSVLTALQRRVDGDAVASANYTFEELETEVINLIDYVDDTFLPLAGGTMTGDLCFQYNANYPVLRIIQSGQNTNHLRFINNNNASQSLSMDLSQAAIHPLVTGRGHVGTSDIHFGDAHIDKIYTGVINNGYDIAVPVTNSADTLALVNADISPLQQQINHLQTIGRFLSFWDATTGLAETNPPESPYTYHTGDYFRVGVVASGGGTNYKPTGSSYTTGVASTVVETNPLTVGQVYYYDGTNWALAAGGSIAIDGTTIVINSDNEIQAVATVNQNTATGTTNPIYNWVGTLAEYNAQNIATLHPDWICYITDDVSGGATGHEVIAFQAPTAENNYTWYRKYADGWVEQGNCKGVVSNTTVNLPVTMLDSNYSVLVTSVATTASPGPLSALVFSKTTTSFSAQNGGGALIVWQVSGMAA